MRIQKKMRIQITHIENAVKLYPEKRLEEVFAEIEDYASLKLGSYIVDDVWFKACVPVRSMSLAMKLAIEDEVKKLIKSTTLPKEGLIEKDDEIGE
jgi:hypothetical protein